ncbi:MAG: hypothetical protein V1676_03380 [Candidatus Diapherotrites archaeon]
MGYLDFETENAKYRLELGSHLSAIKNAPRYDAIIYEYPPQESGILHFATHEQILPYGASVFSFAKKNGIPIFMADAEPKKSVRAASVRKNLLKSLLILGGSGAAAGAVTHNLMGRKMNRRGFTALMAELFAIATVRDLWGTLPLARSGEIKKRRLQRWLYAKTFSIWPDPWIEVRNVIMAEKAESFIAPMLAKSKGRKPTIYVPYGACHAGIPEALKDAGYRKKVLEAFYPLEKYFVKEGLHDCGHLQWDPIKKEWAAAGIFTDVLKETPPKAASAKAVALRANKTRNMRNKLIPRRTFLNIFARKLK